MTAIVSDPGKPTTWRNDSAGPPRSHWRGEQPDEVPVFDKGHTIVADPARRAGLSMQNPRWAQEFHRNAADRRPARMNVTAALMGDPKPGRGHLGGGR